MAYTDLKIANSKSTYPMGPSWLVSLTPILPAGTRDWDGDYWFVCWHEAEVNCNFLKLATVLK